MITSRRAHSNRLHKRYLSSCLSAQAQRPLHLRLYLGRRRSRAARWLRTRNDVRKSTLVTRLRVKRRQHPADARGWSHGTISSNLAAARRCVRDGGNTRTRRRCWGLRALCTVRIGVRSEGGGVGAEGLSPCFLVSDLDGAEVLQELLPLDVFPPTLGAC